MKTENKSEKVQGQRKRWHLPTNRYWLMVGLGAGLLGISIVFGALWMASPLNQVLGVITIALFIAGLVILVRQFKHRGEMKKGALVNIGDADGAKSTQPKRTSDEANSLNIYAGHDPDIGAVVPQRVVFENMYKPMGQPQRCLNTGKDYFVHIWDIDRGKLVPFVLADRKYTDPSILARYLGLPAQRKYLRNRESLMRFLGPGLLVIANIIGFITIIALSGG